MEIRIKCSIHSALLQVLALIGQEIIIMTVRNNSGSDVTIGHSNRYRSSYSKQEWHRDASSRIVRYVCFEIISSKAKTSENNSGQPVRAGNNIKNIAQTSALEYIHLNLDAVCILPLIRCRIFQNM